LQLRLQAVAQKGTGKNTNLKVIVQTSGKDLAFKQNNGVFTTKLSFSLGVFAKDGKSVFAERPDADLNLRPETYARVVKSGVRLVRQISVAPGRYQLRVAAQDSSKAKQGTAILDLDVPDFTKPDIALSGVALAANADPSVATGSAPDVLNFGGGLPGAPSTLREFPANSEFAAFVEVYDNKPAPPHRLDVAATVKADDGRVVFTHGQEYSSDELHGQPGGFGFSARVPLTGWTPGVYVLTITATSRLSNQEPVSKVIQFEVK
jgi:hypothetical protein